MARREDALFNRRRSYQESRNKNPWLDELVIAAVTDSKSEHEKHALSYYSTKDFKKYENVEIVGQTTALHMAAKNQRYDLIRSFIELGAPINSSNQDGITALHFFLMIDYEQENEEKVNDVALMMLNKGADINHQSNNGESALHIAAKYGYEEVIKMFLQRDANLFIVTKSNQTPIDLALNYGRHSVVALLLEFMKKRLNEKNYEKNIQAWYATKESQLFKEIASGDIEAAKALIAKGTNVNTYHIKELFTVLHGAVAKTGNVGIVKFLLEKGANINAIDRNGETVLDIAVKMQHKVMIESLLSYRPNLAICNNAGELVIDRTSKLPEIAKFFDEVINSNASMPHLKLFKVLRDKNITELTLQDNIDDYLVSMIEKRFAENNRLTKIDLQNNHIQNRGAQAIANLIKHNPLLVRLDLSKNSLRDEGAIAIVEALKTCHSLEFLDFSQNVLSDKTLKMIAKILREKENVQLTMSMKLIICCIEQSEYSSFDLLMRNEFLKTAIKAETAVVVAKVTLNKLAKRLRRFNNSFDTEVGTLDGIYVTNYMHVDINEFIKVQFEKHKEKNVTEILVVYNRYRYTPALNIDRTLFPIPIKIQDYGKFYEDLPALLTIEFTHDQLHRKDSILEIDDAVINVIKSNDLKEIDLSGKIKSSEEFTAVMKIIKEKHAQLSILKLSSNRITNEDLRVLLDAIRNKHKLTELDLSNNEFGDKGVLTLAAELLLIDSCFLTSLNLSGNKLGADSIETFVDILFGNRTLLKLDLSNNVIQSRYVYRLFDGIRENQYLIELNLNNNSFRDGGALVRTQILKDSCVLTSLFLENNVIESEGIEALAQMLKENRSLSRLSLCNSRFINPQSAVVLADAFKENNTLTHISLFTNANIDEVVIQAIAEALKQNRSIIWMDIEQLKSDSLQLINEIKEALQYNAKLAQQFLDAAKEGEANKVEQLIKQGVSPLVEIGNGENALYWATYKGHREVVELLAKELVRRNIRPIPCSQIVKDPFKLAEVFTKFHELDDSEIEKFLSYSNWIIEFLSQQENLLHEKLTNKSLVRNLDQSINQRIRNAFMDIVSRRELYEEKAEQGHQEIALKYGTWLLTTKASQKFSKEKCLFYLGLATKGPNLVMAQEAFDQLSQLDCIDSARKLVEMDVEIPAVTNESNKPLILACYLQKADQYLLNDDFSSAIKYYDLALELDANNIYAISRKGIAHEKLKEFDKALQVYQALNTNQLEKYQLASNNLKEIKEREFNLRQSLVTMNSADTDREELPSRVNSKPELRKLNIPTKRTKIINSSTVPPFSQNQSRIQFSTNTTSPSTNASRPNENNSTEESSRIAEEKSTQVLK